MHWHMVTTLLLVVAVPLLPVSEAVLPPLPLPPPPPFSVLAAAAGTCGCWAATVAPLLKSTKATWAAPEAACMTPPTALLTLTWPTPLAKATTAAS